MLVMLNNVIVLVIDNLVNGIVSRILVSKDGQ